MQHTQEQLSMQWNQSLKKKYFLNAYFSLVVLKIAVPTEDLRELGCLILYLIGMILPKPIKRKWMAKLSDDFHEKIYRLTQ